MMNAAYLRVSGKRSASHLFILVDSILRANSLVSELRSELRVIVLFLLLGFIILLHQFLTWGVWFQPSDVHHETFALICFAVAFGICIGMMFKHENVTK